MNVAMPIRLVRFQSKSDKISLTFRSTRRLLPRSAADHKTWERAMKFACVSPEKWDTEAESQT